MSKKIKPTGKKLKNLSDSNLAQSHKKTTKLEFLLTSVDPRWGRYLYHLYNRHGLILKQSLQYYKKTINLLNQCRKLNADEKTGFRIIPDKLRDKLEINSVQFLILLKLGLEYLVAEYQPVIKQIKKYRGENYTDLLDTSDLADRFRNLKNAIGINSVIPTQFYTILNRRDIIEHPTTDRLQDCSETGWKSVSLSWILSGEIEGIIDPIVYFINDFIKKVEVYRKDNPIPGKLTGLIRGVKAGEQYKKYK